MLLHLVLSPAVIYLIGHLITVATGGAEPVWFYGASFVGWLGGLVYLALRFEPYVCPRCATKVHPSGAISLLPLPCPKCGLKMPLVER